MSVGVGGEVGKAWLTIGTNNRPMVEGLNQAKGEADKFGNSVKSSVDRAASAMTAAGKTATVGLTLPILGVATAAAATAGNFEAGMNRVSAVSGATAAQLEQLKAQAIELGASTKFSAAEAADAMGFLAMAGFDTNEIMGAMPSTLQLAAAAAIDLGTAADITSNILTGFGLEVTELGHANDVLVAMMANANVDLQMLGQSFKYVGPIAKSAGLSFEETAAAIALMGNAGIQGSMAGTSLRQAITKLLNPTDEAAAVMERLGINAVDASGNLLPLDQVLRQLEDSGASTADMMTIFGQRAGPAMAALVSQGTDALLEMIAVAEESGGAAERIADIQMQGLNGAIEEMRGAIETALIIIGNDLIPILVSLAGTIQTAAQAFTEMPDGIRLAVIVLAALTAAVGPLLLGLGMLVKAFMAVRVASLALGLTGGPIGLILLALSALVAGIVLVVAHWDTLTAAFPEIGYAAGQAQQAIGWIIDKLAELGAVLQGPVTTGLRHFVALVAAVVQSAVGFFESLWSTAKMIFGNLADLITTSMEIASLAAQGKFSEIDDAYGAMMKRQQERTEEWVESQKSAAEKSQGFMERYRDTLETLNNLSTPDPFGGKAEQVLADLNAMEDGAGAMSDELRAMAEASDEVAGSLAKWDEAQAYLNASIEVANTELGIWESKLSGAEQARDHLLEKQEAGIQLSAEETSQLETLNWAVGRYTGGVEDQMKAVVAAQVRQAEFIKLQDDLTRAYETGEMSLEDYNATVAAAKANLDPFEDSSVLLAQSQKELATAFDGVITKLRDLLVDLGLLPEEVRSEVTVETQQAEEGLNRVGSWTVDDKGFAVEADTAEAEGSLSTLDLHELNAKLIKVEGDPVPALTAMDEVERHELVAKIQTILGDNDLALQSFDEVELRELLDKILLVRADTNEADAALDETDARQIHAKLFRILGDNAEALASLDEVELRELLDKVQLILGDNSPALTSLSEVEQRQLLDKIQRILGENGDVLTKIGQVQTALAGVPSSFTVVADVNIAPALTKIQQLNNQIPRSPAKEGPFRTLPTWDAVFEGIELSASRRTEEGIAHVQKFASTLKTVIDALRSELDLRSAAQDAPGPLDVELLQSLMTEADRAVAIAAELASTYDGELLEHVQTYAKARSDVYKALSDQTDFAQTWFDAEEAVSNYLQVAEHIQNDLITASDSAVRAFGYAAGRMAEDGVPAADEYAGQVEAVYKAATTVLEFAEKAARLLTGADGIHLPTNAVSSAIKFHAEHLTESFGWSEARLQREGVPNAEGYAGQVEAVYGAALTILDFAERAAELLDGNPGLELPAEAVSSALKFHAEHTVESFAWSAAKLQREGVPAAGDYLNAVEQTYSALVKILDFVARMAELARNGGEIQIPTRALTFKLLQLAQFAVQTMLEAVHLLETEGAEAQARYAKAVESTMGGILKTLDFITRVADLASTGAVFRIDLAERLVRPIIDLARTAVDVLESEARAFSESETERLQATSEALAAPFDVLLPAIQTVQGMLELSAAELDPAAVNHLIGILFAMSVDLTNGLLQVAAMTDTEGLEAALLYADAMSRILSVIKLAGEAFTAIRDMAALPHSAVVQFGTNLLAVFDEVRKLIPQTKTALEDAQEFAELMHATATAIRDGVLALTEAGGHASIKVDATWGTGETNAGSSSASISGNQGSGSGTGSGSSPSFSGGSSSGSGASGSVGSASTPPPEPPSILWNETAVALGQASGPSRSTDRVATGQVAAHVGDRLGDLLRQQQGGPPERVPLEISLPIDGQHFARIVAPLVVDWSGKQISLERWS